MPMPTVIGLLRSLASNLRTFGWDALAEGVRLKSNGLGICSNNVARAGATGIQPPR
jgi:hypothetical protein